MNELGSVEKTLIFIRNNSEKYAKAKADRIYLEQFRKSKKAMLVDQAAGMGYKTVQERESYAYRHDEYMELLMGLKQAIEIEEKLRWQLEAAKARIEIWRTMQANNRAEYNAGGLQT